MKCSKCNRELKKNEPICCGVCFVNQMWELEKLGLVQSEKKKHYDTGKKHLDTYRFWFISYDKFKDKILSETLLAYTVGNFFPTEDIIAINQN